MLGRVSANFLSQTWTVILTFADRFILVGIILRVWGTEVYGEWATLFAAAGLIFMMEFGLNIYFGNRWQLAFAHQNEKSFQRYLSLSLWIYVVLVLGLGVVVAIYAITTNFVSTYSIKTLSEYDAALIFLMFSGGVVTRIMRGSISQVYRGRGIFAEGTLLNSLAPLMIIVLCGGAVLLGANPVSVSFFYWFSELFVLILIAWDLKRRFPHLLFKPSQPTRAEIQDIFRQGSWFGLLQGAPVAWLQVPVLLLGATGLSGRALVGFIVMRTVANFARMVVDLIARSVAVEAAEFYHRGLKDQVSRTAADLGRFLSVVSGAIAAGLFVFGASLIFVWTGNNELHEEITLVWLLLPVVLIAPFIPISNILVYGNLPRLIGIASMVQIAIGLTLCFYLAKIHGISGAVAGLALGEIIGFAVFLPLLARRHIELSYGDYYGICLLRIILSGAWSFGVAWLLQTGFGTDPVAQLLISGSLWVLLGFLPPVIFALPEGLRKRLRNIAMTYLSR